MNGIDSFDADCDSETSDDDDVDRKSSFGIDERLGDFEGEDYCEFCIPEAANPKSPSLSWNASSRKRFSSLRSRW